MLDFKSLKSVDEYITQKIAWSIIDPAVYAVIMAVRETTIYLRIIREKRPKSIAKETKLSLLWTELTFKIDDLGLKKLANRCSVMGQYWADPAGFSEDFFKTADIDRIRYRKTCVGYMAKHTGGGIRN